MVPRSKRFRGWAPEPDSGKLPVPLESRIRQSQVFFRQKSDPERVRTRTP